MDEKKHQGYFLFDVRIKDLIQRFGAMVASDSLRDWMLGIFFLYLARTNTEAFGYFMLAMSAGAIVLKVVEFGFNHYLIRQLGADSTLDIEMVASVNLIKLILLGVCFHGLLVFCWLMDYSADLRLYVIFIGLGMGARSLGDSLYMVFRILGRQITESAIKFSALALSLIWAVALIELGMDPVWTSTILILNALLNIIIAVFVLNKDLSLIIRPCWRLIRRIISQGLPFTLLSLFAILANKTNIFFLQHLAGSDAVALFMASWLIVDTVSCTVSSHFLEGVIYPLLSQNQNQPVEQSLAGIRRTFISLLALAWPICLLLHEQSGLLIQLIYGDGYEGAQGLHRILLWTIPVAFFQNLCLSLAMVRGRIYSLAGLFGLALLVNLALNWLLIPDDGATGAAWVILLTKVCMCTLVFGYCQRTLTITRIQDWMIVIGLAIFLGGLYALFRLVMPVTVALVTVLLAYGWFLWRWYKKSNPRVDQNADSMQNKPLCPMKSYRG